jgi:hypothetical protein
LPVLRQSVDNQRWNEEDIFGDVFSLNFSSFKLIQTDFSSFKLIQSGFSSFKVIRTEMFADTKPTGKIQYYKEEFS